MRFELTITGFAVQSLWPDLATRANVGPQLHTDLQIEEKTFAQSNLSICVYLCNLWLIFGAEREIRTLEASLEDSHVSSYIIPAADFRFKI